MPVKRIIWKSGDVVKNAESLLKSNLGQAGLPEVHPPLVLPPGAGIVVDFGVEIQGMMELFTPWSKSHDPTTVRQPPFPRPPV